MNRPYAREQLGFTLIELVVVIVILAVLAAVAVPRFIGMDSQARIASVKTLAAAVQQAADSVHTACLAKLGNCDVNVQVAYPLLNGESIHTIYDGHKVATSAFPA